MTTRLLLATFAFASSLAAVRGADLPNILWITSEDNASNWLGCYGNKEALTPRLDALAAQGLCFTTAYANAPVCAVARSTILNGAYAVTQGTQHMRSRHPIPEIFRSYVSYLRDKGYYCTNNAKTDYNFKGNDGAIWDECSNNAHYLKRPAGKPFFAVFNLLVSHESSLFAGKIQSNRKEGIIPPVPRIDPSKVTVPPHLPDLPEIRSDIAIYHDNMTAMDTQVGKLLDELDHAGLADDTIVFYYSDHGGITPRGKRYLNDTGTRVPLLIRVPAKWQALCPFPAGKPVDELVAFVDLAPTLLSLAGLDKPSQMQGRAFLGSKRAEPKPDALVFLYADRFDETYGMRRGLTDGKWKYIRRFTPHLPAAPYSQYQFGQAGWTAWRKAWQDGKLSGLQKEIWEPNQPVEELFDIQSDPWEIRNLATDPAQHTRLETMRSRLRQTMIDTRDTGIIPEPMFAELSAGKPVADYLAARSGDIPALVDLAFAASSRDAAHLAEFQQKLSSADPVTRYWAAQGCLILGKNAAPASAALMKLSGDPSSAVRVSAAEALANLDHRDQAVNALVAELRRVKEEFARLNAVNALSHLGAVDAIPKDLMKSAASNGKAGEYLQRAAGNPAKKHGAGKPGKAENSGE